MANSFTSVQPGDIISSDLMNYLLTKLGEIDQRVTTLEQGGGSVGQVTITSFEPPNQIASGQELTVHGTNFDFPPTNNTVTIDGTQLTSFRPGSTSTVLKFIVPTTLVIPSGGKNVTISVENSLGEFHALYRVLPAVQAPGDPPVIETVLPAAGDFIFANQPIIITGQNFAANPEENIIRFRLIVGGGPEVVYPKPLQTIAINAANSNTTQIEATVPNITEVPAGQSRNVTLEVGVGAHVPAVRVISVRQPAV
ncbi:MAG: IPT/TIG domain-containing protein [Chloroflexia bacterium]